jgi:hypothetical protein
MAARVDPFGDPFRAIAVGSVVTDENLRWLKRHIPLHVLIECDRICQLSTFNNTDYRFFFLAWCFGFGMVLQKLRGLMPTFSGVVFVGIFVAHVLYLGFFGDIGTFRLEFPRTMDRDPCLRHSHPDLILRQFWLYRQ